MVDVIDKYEVALLTDAVKIATALDPTVPKEIRKQYRDLVVRVMENEYGYKAAANVNNTCNAVSVVAEGWSSSSSDSEEETDLTNHTYRMDNEFDVYLQHKIEIPKGESFCLLSYWKKGESVYPTLGRMARDYHAAQATSCCSERGASAAKRTLDERKDLSPESFRLEMLMSSWETTGIDLKKYQPHIINTV
jgi:hypothetical protein